MKIIFKSFVCLLPWSLKRVILRRLYKYELHPESRIGFSYVFPDKLTMERGSRIGNLNVIKNLQAIKLGEFSFIGDMNWISAHPHDDRFFKGVTRERVLEVGDHSAITMRHRFDCTASITIGCFTTIAGSNSLFMTHSIDLAEAKQQCQNIKICDYCFVGTHNVVIGGVSIPDFSVISAMSFCNKKYSESYSLYGGVPARRIKPISSELKYFRRKQGEIL